MANDNEVMISVLLKQINDTLDQACALANLDSENDATELFSPIVNELNERFGKIARHENNSSQLLYDAVDFLHQVGGDDYLAYGDSLRCFVAAKIVLSVLETLDLGDQE
jgi:hypothetical protein